jgi:hypothetical protein
MRHCSDIYSFDDEIEWVELGVDARPDLSADAKAESKAEFVREWKWMRRHSFVKVTSALSKGSKPSTAGGKKNKTINNDNQKEREMVMLSALLLTERKIASYL